MLQGLCLISTVCKAALGEAWVIEVRLIFFGVSCTAESGTDLHRLDAATSGTSSIQFERLKADHVQYP